MTISETGTRLTVDGVPMVFQMTPGTEAPAEMNVLFPQHRAVWMAENATHTMHNILTLRGAKVRDPLIWAHYLGETVELWGDDFDSEFASHHWPMWGNERIVEFLGKQRDMYKYLHDQTVRLMNEGYTGIELSNAIELPPEIGDEWYSRGYYGSTKHNTRAIYQRYMGFYDGNPSTLDELPPTEAAVKYVAYMGGPAAVLDKARADFDKGEYRWVAMALKHVVFADAGNASAKALLADAYEQLGYQAESGPWRSIYLQGAHELRNGVPTSGGTVTASADTQRAMSPELMFDYLGVRLNGPEAVGKHIVVNIDFTDLDRTFGLTVENGVLRYAERAEPDAVATLTLARATLDDIHLGKTTLAEAKAAGDVRIEGQEQAFVELLGLLDEFDFWFPIVTPRKTDRAITSASP